jgi:hypothetical protein
VGNLQPERRKSLAFSPVSFNRLPSRFVPTIPNHLPTATSLGLRVISCPRKRIAATMLAATNRAPVGVVSCANTPDFALASLERNPTHNNDRPTHSTCIRVRTNSGVAIEPRPSRVLIADHEQMPRLRNDRSDTRPPKPLTTWKHSRRSCSESQTLPIMNSNDAGTQG